jgi:ribosomal protein S27AE
MDPDEDLLKNAVKFKPVRVCPRCGNISLYFKKDKIICSECGYSENIPQVK